MKTILLPLVLLCVAPAFAMDRVQVAPEGQTFILSPSGTPFVPWGVNYDHDDSGRLLDEYWIEEWDTVVQDFHEIHDLGANTVRIHLQFGKFMDSADQPNAAAISQLGKLLELAEQTGLYLDLTGLACYHKANVPEWYDQLSEQDRWQAQANFWKAVARVGSQSPAVFCYDLMNEPVIGGGKSPTDWLAGEPLGNKYFVQRISIDNGTRSREEVARDWVKQLSSAIREVDEQHLVTVGVIPWAHVWPNAKPVFYSPEAAKHLDFVSVHFYPEHDQQEKALNAVKVYDIGKPIVIEEMFPLKCSPAELLDFVHKSRPTATGWISFYWGKPIEQLDEKTIGGKITADWLRAFHSESEQIQQK